jgi:hypothetical protein
MRLTEVGPLCSLRGLRRLRRSPRGLPPCIALPQATGHRPQSSRLAFSEPHTYRRSRRIVSSREVRMSRLSAVQRCCVHSPAPESTVRRTGTTQHVPFRPRGFSPPRRLAPLHRLRVCFAPLPAMRFTTLPASPRAHHRGDGARLAFPIVHEPFEVCPRRSRAVSPRSFPP